MFDDGERLRCSMQSDRYVLVLVFDRVGIWLGHLGRSIRCSPKDFRVVSQVDDLATEQAKLVRKTRNDRKKGRDGLQDASIRKTRRQVGFLRI